MSSSAAESESSLEMSVEETEEEPVSSRQSSVKKRPPSSPRQRPGSAKKRISEERKRWTTLTHNGVMFPPDYEPHGVKPLYDGEPIDLTPEQEEAVTFYAVMLDTDYVKKSTFVKNYWEDLKQLLGNDHVIQDFDKIDFKPIYDWHQEERLRKKNMSKEERKQLRLEKLAQEEKYRMAMVDGQPEQVGNFRVEPPGLFRGRGEHPRMGRIKRRIYPRDITINISPEAPIPEHPYTGQSWKAVRHDDTVTWLAFWKDPISPKDFKYVFLAANSTFKSESDMAKYEKARKLKEHIDGIRSQYKDDWTSTDPQRRQMGTALYFIDRLALRAGHEKDEDEADTVGCCTLKVENVECVPPHEIKFDFLGKDSIRYVNQVKVEQLVFENVQKFCATTSDGKAKKPADQLFELFDAQDLNRVLKELMDGLSAKVFRTYNASITLQQQLECDVDEKLPVDRKRSAYDEANKQVAILCNHQRAIPKTHGTQIEKLTDKVKTLEKEVEDLDKSIDDLRSSSISRDQKQCDSLRKRREKKLAQKEKVLTQMENKESMKTVALGTSKINYLDPRITVAWCKRNEMPIEKIYTNTLLQKFGWAMTQNALSGSLTLMEFGPELPTETSREGIVVEVPCTYMRSLKGHEGPILAVRFNSQGSYCISCGKDRTARLWNPYRGVLIKTYTGHGYEVRDACIAEDNAKFVTCGGDRQIFLWDVTTGNTIRKLKGHDATVNCVVYAAEEEVLISGGYDKIVNIWDCRSRNAGAIQQLTGFKDSVTCVRASRYEIFASSVDGILKRFDLRVGRAYMDQFKEPITSFELSKDGASMLCACMADAMVLLDREEGSRLATYSGHRHESMKIECGFTRNDGHVFAGSEDGSIFFWELVDAIVVKRFQAHDDTVCSCIVHPEQNSLLTSSTDGTIKFWQ